MNTIQAMLLQAVRRINAQTAEISAGFSCALKKRKHAPGIHCFRTIKDSLLLSFF